MNFTATRLTQKTDYWNVATMRWQCKTTVSWVIEFADGSKKIMTSKEFSALKKKAKN